MFGDNEEHLIRSCQTALDMYTLDAILEMSDLTDLNVLKYLVESRMVDLDTIWADAHEEYDYGSE